MDSKAVIASENKRLMVMRFISFLQKWFVYVVIGEK
jgi:hypothetical protein